jgi:hypothetical protein
VHFFCPRGADRPVRVSDGYYTTGGSSHFTRTGQAICEPGYYCNSSLSLQGDSGVRYLCPAGVYGSTSGLITSSCTEACPTGHYCPAGSVLPTKCPAGRYGGTTGLKTKECTGPCSPGYYCPPKSNSTTQVPCPAGRYGESEGLPSAHCTLECLDGYCKPTVCDAGYYCPPGSSSRKQYSCGAVDRFCPPGSSYFRNVTGGYYTVSALADDHLAEGALFEECQGSKQAGVAISPDCSKDDAASRRSGQLRCPKGHYCIEGVKVACPSGKYGGTVGLQTNSCSGACNPGFFCGDAAENASETQCGSPAVFCPLGSPQPISVSSGYYTVGGAFPTMSAQIACEPGHYCMKGIKRKCPAGRYGDVSELNSKDCSGPCQEGHYCPKGSTSATQVQCPAGTWGGQGLETADCSGKCFAGYYCPLGSSSPMQNECGGEYKYCPHGSGAPQNVDIGYYSTGGSSSTRTGQNQCEASAAYQGRGSKCPMTTRTS